MGTYQPLFFVSVKHVYFSDGLWKGIDFLPSAHTLKLVESAGVLIRPTQNGIGVFYDVSKVKSLRLYAEETDNTLPFGFKAQVKDRTFANYTSPSAQQDSAILCFDGRAGVTDAESEKTRLSKSDFVGEDDFEEINTLIAEGVLCDQDRRKLPDFVLKIPIAFGQHEDFVAKDYVINFNARQARWKYHLLGNMNRSDPFIVDLDSRVEFEFCGEAMLLGSKPAKVFRSKELIPVLEKSNYRFQLREPGPGAGKVLIKRLPVASESRLGIEVVDGKREIILESFVNY